jgi:hypothetical protein
MSNKTLEDFKVFIAAKLKALPADTESDEVSLLVDYEAEKRGLRVVITVVTEQTEGFTECRWGCGVLGSGYLVEMVLERFPVSGKESCVTFV